MKKIFFLFVVILFGCKSMPMVKSIPESANVKDDFSYYNAEQKILYKVTNDEKNLHVILNTNEEASIMKILRTGLTIYFDVTGKTKKEVFVHYPFKLNQGATKTEYSSENSGKKSERTLNYFVSQIPRELIFSSFGKTENINLTKQDAEIKDTITVRRDSEITYELIIPLSKISINGSLPLTNLSIGVISGKFDIPAGAMKAATGKPRDVAPGGVGGSPGKLEADETVVSPGGMDISAMGVPINFWFKVTLL